MTRLVRRDRGFSLVELIVVVAVIGVLAAVAVPTLLSQRARARDAAVQSDLRSLAVAVATSTGDGGVLDVARVRADVRVSAGNVLEVVDDGAGRCVRGWYGAPGDGRRWVLDTEGLAVDDTRCTGAVELQLP